MEFWSHFAQLSSAVREFVAPRYRPELHYMRGPGPAYRRRVAMLEGRRQAPRFGGDVTLAGPAEGLPGPRFKVLPCDFSIWLGFLRALHRPGTRRLPGC